MLTVCEPAYDCAVSTSYLRIHNRKRMKQESERDLDRSKQRVSDAMMLIYTKNFKNKT